jgi:hypothetical protein
MEIHVYEFPTYYFIRLRWGADILDERTFPTADAVAGYAQANCKFVRIVQMDPDLAVYFRWVMTRYGIRVL